MTFTDKVEALRLEYDLICKLPGLVNRPPRGPSGLTDEERRQIEFRKACGWSTYDIEVALDVSSWRVDSWYPGAPNERPRSQMPPWCTMPVRDVVAVLDELRQQDALRQRDAVILAKALAKQRTTMGEIAAELASHGYVTKNAYPYSPGAVLSMLYTVYDDEAA